MGFNNCFFIIWIIFCVSRSRFIQGMNQSYNSKLLDDFLHDYAYKKILRPRTGILYNLSLPANFSGMEVSFTRFRTNNFYSKGANLSSFDIPSSILPTPFVRRFDVIYQNLGNWSSCYYNVPNYTLVAPVVGFMVYNDTNPSSTRNSTLSLQAKGKPILVHFPRISLLEGDKNATMKCVRFGMNGSVEITNMTSPNVCVARQEGHFSMVVSSHFPPSSWPKKKDRFWNWWVKGFGVGIVGLVLLGALVVLTYKFVKRKRIVKMEKESERSEALGTVWVGDSKMPSAEGIRTQPVLENEDVP